MADSSPVTKLFRPEKGDDLVTRLLSTTDVRSSGQFALNETGFEIDNVVLTSDPIKVRGFYRERNGLKAARLLVAREPIAVGIEINGQNRRIILQNAFGWYETNIVGE